MVSTSHAGPTSLLSEHEDLLDKLEYARSRKGDVGESANALHAALSIHMEREESVFVVLASAEDLAAGNWPHNVDQLLERAQMVERDLKKMQKEHDLIATLLRQLRKAAERDKEEEIVQFCDDLARHAEMEEQVLYPAAVIAGRYLKQREQAAPHESAHFE